MEIYKYRETTNMDYGNIYFTTVIALYHMMQLNNQTI